MNKLTFEWVDDWQEARNIHPDEPVILVRLYGTTDFYMRYRGEFYLVDTGSYAYFDNIRNWRRWRVGGVWFNPDSVAWMANNSINYPFSTEDLVLYQLTWGDIRE